LNVIVLCGKIHIMKKRYWFDDAVEKLDHSFGHLAINNLILYIIGFMVIVYSLTLVNPSYDYALMLIMSEVFKGQVWRLITYVFIPPPLGVIFLFFALYFLYIIGSALEREWGSFRLNLFFLIGMICTTFIGIIFPRQAITGGYIILSLFLAFAALYPDFEVYIFFLIPIKVKYLGYLSWFSIIMTLGFAPWAMKCASIISVMNYLLFFWPSILANAKLMYHGWKPSPYSSKRAKGEEAFHKCTACKKTDRDDESLDFRVCSVCGHEYCEQCIKGHSHK